MTYETIARTLSTTKLKVSEWFKRTVRENQEKQDRKIKELWLACHT